MSGLDARRLALGLLEAVLVKHRAFDDALATALAQPQFAELPARDLAFARLLSATVLRRHGQLAALVGTFLDKPLPTDAARARLILLIGAAQLVLLAAPPHAAIHTAVELCRADRRSARFRGLVNAVLRRVAERGREILAAQDVVALNVPEWLLQNWTAAYGAELARAIALASLQEAPLDITPKGTDGVELAQHLGGVLLPTGSVRLPTGGRVDALDGFSDGRWWVQDAASALPARLFGPVEGRAIADLCAAPGGKTAQLAAAGARVTAVDISAGRLAQLQENLNRLQLLAETITADVRTWQPDAALDGILLDAPCSATGTIRRHPDILHLKSPETLAALTALQAELLAHVAGLLAPGGVLIYCTCSLEPQEGPDQVAKLLAARPELQRRPITASEVGGLAALITAEGDVRSLPCHDPSAGMAAPGIDGFFISRLVLPV
ncbi:MAG: methyltransferase domain-containing protein [Hyphomicrobiaceae bacterium]|nr:methyltransferase domain-containing protein [Hyphomicrobiaceae bacterium]